MSVVTRAGAAAPKSRVTDLLKVKVLENDPQLKVSATAFGFKLSGTATNNGIIASFVKLSFDGHDLSTPVSRGDSSAKVFAKLKRGLPAGYEMRVLANDRMNPPNLTIGIARKHASGPAKVDVAKIPQSIIANAASASVESKLWVDLMPGRGHPNAIGTVTVKGTGFADAPPTFKVKSIEVYEKGSNKKVCTLANPKMTDTQTLRGQKSQTYRVEIPRSKLDMSKTYAFVTNTGINGSKPQLVRSEYEKIDKVY
jgi:hypothetical protein